MQGVKCVFNDVLNFSIVAKSICDKQPKTVVLKPLNDTVTYVLKPLKQYNWTNITLTVENEYGLHVLSHSIKINRTGKSITIFKMLFKSHICVDDIKFQSNAQ